MSARLGTGRIVDAASRDEPRAGVKGGAMKDHRGGEKLCLSQKSA